MLRVELDLPLSDRVGQVGIGGDCVALFGPQRHHFIIVSPVVDTQLVDRPTLADEVVNFVAEIVFAVEVR